MDNSLVGDRFEWCRMVHADHHAVDRLGLCEHGILLASMNRAFHFLHLSQALCFYVSVSAKYSTLVGNKQGIGDNN